MKNRFLILMLCGVMTVSCITGCGSSRNNNPAESSTQTGQVTVNEGKITNELKEATALKPGFQMGETYFQLGTATVKDIIDAGAEFDENDEVTALTYTEDDNNERTLHLTYNNSPFTIGVKNPKSEANEIANSVITQVYADKGDFYSLGGISFGNTVDDVTAIMGDPYVIADGSEVATELGDVKAYCYAGRWNDINVYFFIERNHSTVVSFSMDLPINYITNIDEISNDQIKELIKQREETAGSLILDTPSLCDVENSGSITSRIKNYKYTSAKLYTLKGIKDTEEFNTGIENIDSAVATSYLVVEYDGTLTYSDEELKYAKFQDFDIKPSYDIHGCFYILNPYFLEDGSIGSNLGLSVIRNQKGVYVSKDKMYEDLFIGANQGYSFDDYDVTERNVVLTNK